MQLGASIVVVLAAGLVGPASPSPSRTQPVDERAVHTADVDLVAFDSCDAALRGFHRAALKRVGPYGLPGSGFGREGVMVADGVTAEAMAAGANQAPRHSTTNIHEPGADEPDLVKTDGRRLITVADSTLRVIDTRAKAVTASVDLPGYAHSLLLHGDRALVMTHGEHFGPAADGPDSSGEGARMVLVDVTGAGAIVGSLAVDGRYVDARMSGSVARVVVHSGPRLDFTFPRRDGPAAEARAADKNRSVVAASTLADWVPRFVLERGGKRSTGQLVDCASISHPKPEPGPSLLTVLTFDLAGRFGTGDPMSITADGAGAVYGTPTSLYVADAGMAHDVLPLQRSGSSPRHEQRTRVYQFDIAGSGKPRYLASGSVKGGLLNQYSMSEHGSHLRIATTIDDRRCCEQRTPKSESVVSVLARQDDKLVRVGHVGGLGKGERIYSVRFLGDVGYVVTFRQTDPLYRLDLSDPHRPRVTGELKITGYSAYLHPLSGDRLLGVGQEATETGRTTGLQVSLFDVGDPGQPRRVAQHQLAHAHSEAEFDPHAFLYWPARGLLVLPILSWSEFGDGGSRALVLRVSEGAITEVGEVFHPANRHGKFTSEVRRSVVIGDALWTISQVGAMVTGIDTLTQRAWLPFG